MILGRVTSVTNIVQNMKFSIENFFSKCEQIQLKRWLKSNLNLRFVHIY